ncbi:helix-turn-helix domain-containing protein [Arabiibacter massiliensis]|uniref:helix-turn-helix domain-containing protein n=1 Tax=Arabiibacter massiliensis TaxID=1870985 RepID=UPI001E2BB2EB|nr:helix-turn-helix domain-containing protein [Arabiibacter massiliensis]
MDYRIGGLMDETAGQVLYLCPAPPNAVQQRELFDEYPDLLTPDHIAEITGQSPATIRAICARGDLPAIRIGKRWYVPKPDLLDYVKAGGTRGLS